MKNDSEKVDLVFSEKELSEEINMKSDYGDVGSSSLCGRVGDNMTYHRQGAHMDGFRTRIWHWAWKDLGKAFVGLLRIFFGRTE